MTLTTSKVSPADLRAIGFKPSRSHPVVYMLNIRHGLAIQAGTQTCDLWITNGAEFVFIRRYRGVEDLQQFVQVLRGS